MILLTLRILSSRHGPLSASENVTSVFAPVNRQFAALIPLSLRRAYLS